MNYVFLGSKKPNLAQYLKFVAGPHGRMVAWSQLLETLFTSRRWEERGLGQRWVLAGYRKRTWLVVLSLQPVCSITQLPRVTILTNTVLWVDLCGQTATLAVLCGSVSKVLSHCTNTALQDGMFCITVLKRVELRLFCSIVLDRAQLRVFCSTVLDRVEIRVFCSTVLDRVE